MFDMIVVDLDVLFVIVYNGENGTSTMPSVSFHSLSPHCRSSCFLCTIFRLLLLSLQHFRNLLLLLLRFPLFACAFLASLFACAAALFVVAVFFKKILFSMISLYFFELKLHGFNVLFCLFTLIMFNRVVLSCILDVNLPLKHVDRESSHDTSVVASHVDHVVGFGIFCVSQIPSLDQNVVNLFFFSSFVSEVFSRTSCRAQCNLVASSNVSSGHLFCFPR